MPSAIRTRVTEQDTLYCLESNRLESYTDSWPHSDDSFCSRTNMAKAGFFFTGTQDCVQCFVCHIKLNNWDQYKDDPVAKHKEISSNCEFAKLGKEEGDLTLVQWCEVICSRSINKFYQSSDKFEQNLKHLEDR